jgi:hypothetical protein
VITWLCAWPTNTTGEAQRREVWYGYEPVFQAQSLYKQDSHAGVKGPSHHRHSSAVETTRPSNRHLGNASRHSHEGTRSVIVLHDNAHQQYNSADAPITNRTAISSLVRVLKHSDIQANITSQLRLHFVQRTHIKDTFDLLKVEAGKYKTRQITTISV